MLLGTFIGLFFHGMSDFNNSYLYGFITSLGEIFVRLLKMIIVPLILSSIIMGVSSIKDQTKIGRLGIKTLLYYVITSLIAIMIGLSLANIIEPGINAATINSAEAFDTNKLNTSNSVFDILKRMIPTNPLSALANGDMLGIIFFSIFFGIALNLVESKIGNSIKTGINNFYIVIMKITEIVIRCAPIGVLGLMTKTIANTGLSVFRELSFYALTIILGLSIHLFIVLPIILIIFVKVNPITHFRAMASAMITAFSTSSSSATLPVTMKCVNQNVKASNEITSFVLPMGATVNMDGTALYECAGVLFIAQALGIPLSGMEQMVVVITALLASIGAAGIPSAGLVMLFIVTDAVGLQSDAVALWVGSMLAIDRPLDMYRTMVNISSDSVGAALIAKSEGEQLY